MSANTGEHRRLKGGQQERGDQGRGEFEWMNRGFPRPKPLCQAELSFQCIWLAFFGGKIKASVFALALSRNSC